MSISLTWLGHSAFIVQMDGHSLLFDPFLTNNPLAAADPRTLQPELILLSHAHSDHFGDTTSIAKQSGAPVVSNFEIGEYLMKHGLKNAQGPNHGGTADFGFVTVKLTLAFHSSSFDDGSYAGEPAGFIVTGKASGSRLYFAGDTALFSDMKLIGEAGLDLALLPIGDYYTMGIDDSIRAIQYLQPRYVVPMHYNTFDEITQNVSEWANRVSSETGATPIVVDPGGSYTLD